MNKAKKLIILLLILTMIPIPIYAKDKDFDGDNTGGPGKGQGSSVSGSTWSSQQQGYRFTIVDRPGNQVSNTIDILRNVGNYEKILPNSSKVTSGGLRYTGSRINRSLNSGVTSYNSDYNKNWDAVSAKQVLTPDGKTIIMNPNLVEIWAIVWHTNKNVTAGGEAFRNWFLAGDISKNPTGGIGGGNEVYESI